ncbi:MAG: RecX family transcriptional regulator [Lachnospiraceae bacterium]|nr:RecX family transcriptional regulator [Lachnospiraceae bacterium]
MKVIKIEDFSKTKCRILLEDTLPIVLYKKDLRRYAIEEGKEISEQQLHILIKEILPHRAKARCMKLLQSRDYTENEMRNKLKGDGYPVQVINEAIEYLYGFHYLDDRRYVEAYYRTYRNRKSRKQILLELQRKGITKDDICIILNELISPEEESEELECIRGFLRKRKYSDNEADCTEREKTKAYLFRKGFEVNDIVFCMKNFEWKNL